MMNVPSFSEDMLPRHFPKAKGQLEQKSPAPPLPSLPGLSLLLDDDNRPPKSEPMRSAEAKKTFEQWKQQNQGMFGENTTTQHRKAEKKQVRFETDKQVRVPTPVSPKSPHLELNYYERLRREDFHQNQRQNDYHYPHQANETNYCDSNERNVLMQRCNGMYSKPTSPASSNGKAYDAASETKAIGSMPCFDRTMLSESTKENCFSGCNQQMVRSNEQKCQGNCCQRSHEHHLDMMNYPSNGCGVDQRQIRHSHQHVLQPKSVGPFNGHVERHLKEQLIADETLLSIMEEQQQHILLQQNQLMMQQKQNMVQQKQIFMLQNQIQQLLVRNPDGLTDQHRPTSICDKPSPRPMPSAIETRTDTFDPGMRNGSQQAGTTTTTRSSIGVMTSFLGNVNGGKGMQQLNGRLTTKLTNEKFIENVGGFSTDEDSMLDKINDALKNSSAMIDSRNNGMADGGDLKRQSDMNIATQALYYETSSTNSNGMCEPKCSDRSFALYMLGMKYDCAKDDAPKKVETRRDWQPNPTNGKTTDQVSVNLSPDVYDYLKRHGLLKLE